MNQIQEIEIDPNLDLVLEREIEVSPEAVWSAWTEPAKIVKWFTPAPWKTVSAELDLRPGGFLRFVMESPEGDQFPNEGCYLEVVPNRKLVWTDTMTQGYRPSSEPFFTAILLLEPIAGGTRYVAIARHGSVETLKKHEEMGFHSGWGAALDQMVALLSEQGDPDGN